MKTWARYPVIYDISAWVWLGDLSRKHGSPVNLGTVPPEEWDKIAEKVFARGRDPSFPAWPDVLQLNAFQPPPISVVHSHPFPRKL